MGPLVYTLALFPLFGVFVMFGPLLLIELRRMIYFIEFRTLKKIPGPRFPATSSLWISWQWWHGKLSFTADDLLSQYGPHCPDQPKYSPCQQLPSLNSIFSRKDLDTCSKGHSDHTSGRPRLDRHLPAESHCPRAPPPSHDSHDN